MTMLITFCFPSSFCQTQSHLLPYLLTESGLSVKMENMKQPVSPGEKLKLVCEADGVKGQLSVTWERQPTLPTSSLFATIISLSENGVTEKATAFEGREVRVTHLTTNRFVFELADVAESDSGIYKCIVSETQPSGGTQSQMENVSVNVKSIGKTCLFYIVYSR